MPKGQKIKCTRCSYRGQFIAKVTVLSNVACPTCRGKLKFVNSKKGESQMVKARVKRMKAKQSKKAKKKATKKATRSDRPVGRTSGVGVTATWVLAMQHNAKVSVAKRRTDKQITAYMKKEFPGRKSAYSYPVQAIRTRYNKGALTGGVAPKRKAVSHDE